MHIVWGSIAKKIVFLKHLLSVHSFFLCLQEHHCWTTSRNLITWRKFIGVFKKMQNLLYDMTIQLLFAISKNYHFREGRKNLTYFSVIWSSTSLLVKNRIVKQKCHLLFRWLSGWFLGWLEHFCFLQFIERKTPKIATPIYKIADEFQVRISNLNLWKLLDMEHKCQQFCELILQRR